MSKFIFEIVLKEDDISFVYAAKCTCTCHTIQKPVRATWVKPVEHILGVEYCKFTQVC